MTFGPKSRHPMAGRDSKIARQAASWLVAHAVTPNQISQMALVFAALGFLSLPLSWLAGPWQQGALLLVAAACAQARLACNLLDGMVAAEGGHDAGDGTFWNEVPDRVCDILLLTGAGVACGAPTLGALAAAGAVFSSL